MFDIVIKTFNRYDSLGKLLRSIEMYYPEQKIIIADDSVNFDKKFYKQFNLNSTILNLGIDVGLSYGRNKAMEQVATEYALLLDDDFVFDNRTNIEKLLTIATHTNAEVIGGSLHTGKKIDGYNQILEIKEDTLFYYNSPHKLETYEGIKYQKCDIVYNFGLFKKSVRWDENIKIKGEHVDCFLKIKKQGGVVYYVPEVIIQHHPARPKEYVTYRNRHEGFIYLMKKHKLKKIVSSNNVVAELQHDTIKTYRL